jgi:hypothetical protein
MLLSPLQIQWVSVLFMACLARRISVVSQRGELLRRLFKAKGGSMICPMMSRPVWDFQTRSFFGEVGVECKKENCALWVKEAKLDIESPKYGKPFINIIPAHCGLIQVKP